VALADLRLLRVPESIGYQIEGATQRPTSGFVPFRCLPWSQIADLVPKRLCLDFLKSDPACWLVADFGHLQQGRA
jgi:hypothetical protein